MKKSTEKKLRLTAETLRDLDLKEAAGGQRQSGTEGTPLPASVGSSDC
jgi:hypothetical protein